MWTSKLSIKEVLQISNNLFMVSEDHPRGAWLASHGSTKTSNTRISINPAQQSASLKQVKDIACGEADCC